MKKRFLLITLILMCSFAFSAGYRNTYWGETMLELAKSGNLLFESMQDNNYVYMREQARVLGQTANIWYCLSNQKLVGICYTIEDTPESRAQVENLLDSRKLKLVTRRKTNVTEEQSKEYREKLEEYSNKRTPIAAFMVEDILSFNLGGNSSTNEWLKAENVETSNSEVIRAEYNIDTEVHIYEGILYGYIIVAYTEIPQDF